MEDILKNSFCHACNLQFHTTLFYTRHLSLVHEIVLETKNESVGFKEELKTSNYDDFETEIDVEESEIKKEPNAFEEEKICNSDDFSKSKYISKNIQRKHIPSLTSETLKKQSNIEKFECQVCNSSFLRRIHLNRHIKIHENKKSHKCSLCNASFARKDNLTKHVKSVHENKRPFKCNICKASFTQSSNVKNHIASVHQNKRPFKCKICNFDFKQKAHLNRHISGVHDNRPIGRVDFWPN